MSVKLEWAEDHTSLYDEYKDDSKYMFIYTDGSLSYDKGSCRTGYRVVAYRNGMEIASEQGPLGAYIEAYKHKMKALEVAVKMIQELVHSKTDAAPSKIIIATDNMGALQHIFQGSPGKAQSCSTTFQSHILDILDKHKNIQFALTWCPGHFDFEGNERADSLAKSGSRMYHRNTDYKSLSYISSIHKRNICEEWTHRWTNQPSTLCSKFHVTNRIPLSMRPTKRVITLDRHTFSQTLQCQTGHTHISKYYCHFVPSKNQSCHCSDTLQT